MVASALGQRKANKLKRRDQSRQKSAVESVEPGSGALGIGSDKQECEKQSVAVGGARASIHHFIILVLPMRLLLPLPGAISPYQLPRTVWKSMNRRCDLAPDTIVPLRLKLLALCQMVDNIWHS
jgi:hypothetical protein